MDRKVQKINQSRDMDNTAADTEQTGKETHKKTEASSLKWD